MPEELHFMFSFHYESKEAARIVYFSMLPEAILENFDRSSVSLSLNDNQLVLEINAKDITAAKASIHSTFRWISTSSNIIRTFSKET
ncbi:MAG: KEOPS complex subunit Pcc1 [Candidatus Hodarchaeales archaeon]